MAYLNLTIKVALHLLHLYQVMLVNIQMHFLCFNVPHIITMSHDIVSVMWTKSFQQLTSGHSRQ